MGIDAIGSANTAIFEQNYKNNHQAETAGTLAFGEPSGNAGDAVSGAGWYA